MRRITVSLVALAVALAPLAVLPSAASAATPATCRTSQLSLSKVSSDGAAGTIYNVWAFTNVSSRACRMRGYPDLQRYDQGGRPFLTRERKVLNPAPSNVVLAPGGKASFVWSYSDVPQGNAEECSTSKVVGVRPPGRSARLYIPFDVPNCSTSIQVSAVAAGVITP